MVDNFKAFKIVHCSTSEVWKILKSLNCIWINFRSIEKFKEFSAGPILGHFTRGIDIVYTQLGGGPNACNCVQGEGVIGLVHARFMVFRKR